MQGSRAGRQEHQHHFHNGAMVNVGELQLTAHQLSRGSQLGDQQICLINGHPKHACQRLRRHEPAPAQLWVSFDPLRHIIPVGSRGDLRHGVAEAAAQAVPPAAAAAPVDQAARAGELLRQRLQEGFELLPGGRAAVRLVPDLRVVLHGKVVAVVTVVTVVWVEQGQQV